MALSSSRRRDLPGLVGHGLLLGLLVLAGTAGAGLGFGDSARFSLNTVSIVDAAQDTPIADSLAPCYPNPFNPRTNIEYRLAQPAFVQLAIYDLRGRLVRVLLDGDAEAGIHVLIWDGRDDRGHTVGGGVYLCRLRAGTFTASQRLTLVK